MKTLTIYTLSCKIPAIQYSENICFPKIKPWEKFEIAKFTKHKCWPKEFYFCENVSFKVVDNDSVPSIIALYIILLNTLCNIHRRAMEEIKEQSKSGVLNKKITEENSR